MKLNLDKQFVDLKGFPLPVQMDDTLSNMLAMATTGPPAKMIAWAVNLTNDGEIDIDEVDAKFLKEFIGQYPTATNLVKSQLLDRIDKVQEFEKRTRRSIEERYHDKKE